MTNQNLGSRVAILLLCLAGAATTALAQDTTWLGGGTWNQGSSWSYGPPDPNQGLAYFGISGAPTSGTILLNTTESAGGFVVSSGNFTLDLGGAQLNMTGIVPLEDLDSLGSGLIVGSGGAATLNIVNGVWNQVNPNFETLFGGNNCTCMMIGQGAGGTVNVGSGDGTSTAVMSSDQLTVGNNSSGALTINPGSRVTAPEGLFIGYSANGSVQLNANTTLGANAFTSIGNLQAGTGTLVMASDGAQFYTGQLYIGDEGNGTLTISSASTIDATQTFIANLPGSTGLLTMSNGNALMTTDLLYVGAAGSGTLNMTAGTLTSNSDIAIGNNAGGVGVVTVSGTATSLSGLGNLYLGGGGIGTLTLTAGIVSIAGDTSVGNNSGGSGTLILNAPSSLLTTGGNLYVGPGGSGVITVTSGSIQVTGNGQIGGPQDLIPGDGMGVVAISGTQSSLMVAR